MSDRKIVDLKTAFVLIVDDNPQNTILLSRLLDYVGVGGYEWKSSSWQVFDRIEMMPSIDLILLDLHLANEDGYQVLAKIRGEPRLANARVVAVTADINPETLEQVKRAGFDGFLGKPINPREFPQQLADILHGKKVWRTGYL